MKFRRNIILGFSLFCLFIGSITWAEVLPTAVPEQVGMSSERLSRIDTALESSVEKGKIPGAVVLIARKGKIVYFKNFGLRDKAASSPMKNDTIFRLYSVTKPLVAVATMILMEEGKLALSDPVAKYIPSFKEIKVGEIKKDASGQETVTTVKPRRAMTVQDLLRHTSGLTYEFWNFKGPIHSQYYKLGINKYDQTIAEMADKLATIPLVAHPGSKYVYSRSFDVLGRVVEVASGMPLDKFMEERLFKPLEMNDTGFHIEQSKLDQVAFLAPKAFLYIDLTKPRIFFAGGEGLVSTAGDLARFCQMLLNGGQLEGKYLLGPKTVAFMTSDHLGSLGHRSDPTYLPGPGYGSGFGFYVRVDAGISYFPGNVGEFYKGGYGGAVFWVDPKEELIGVYMMSDPAHSMEYRYLVKSLIYQAILD